MHGCIVFGALTVLAGIGVGSYFIYSYVESSNNYNTLNSTASTFINATRQSTTLNISNTLSKASTTLPTVTMLPRTTEQTSTGVKTSTGYIAEASTLPSTKSDVLAEETTIPEPTRITAPTTTPTTTTPPTTKPTTTTTPTTTTPTTTTPTTTTPTTTTPTTTTPTTTTPTTTTVAPGCNYWVTAQTLTLDEGVIFDGYSLAAKFNCANLPIAVSCNDTQYNCAASGISCKTLTCNPVLVSVQCCSTNRKSFIIHEINATQTPALFLPNSPQTIPFNKQCNMFISFTFQTPQPTGEWVTLFPELRLDAIPKMCRAQGLKCIFGVAMNMAYAGTVLLTYANIMAARLVSAARDYDGIYISGERTTSQPTDHTALLNLMGNITAIAPDKSIYLGTNPYDASNLLGGDIPILPAIQTRYINLGGVIPLFRVYETRQQTVDYFVSEMNRFKEQAVFPTHKLMPAISMRAYSNRLNYKCVNYYPLPANYTDTHFIDLEPYYFTSVNNMLLEIQASDNQDYGGFGVSDITCDYNLDSPNCFGCLAHSKIMRLAQGIYT
ncbi:ORF34-like protein [Bufonid herpesvirus 1]|uniref:ORF34-like protein n=1 Tax=Bufonid herpesvirus 1 TaxID=2282206 RepID=UPI000EB623B7|nr:ORF34-like protein [Bufonid herpesvirus 1]AXF48617.1 ORF34-like protein [Bufonid herpesvirus 1]